MNVSRSNAFGALSRFLPIASFRVDPWSAVLRRLTDRLEIGQCRVVLPNGSAFTATGQRDRHRRADLRVHDLRTVRDLVWRGKNGFAEAYLDGCWSSPALADFLHLMLDNENALGGYAGRKIGQIADRLAHLRRGNSKAGSKRNIAYHYDLSNDFYAAWLDPGMTYSSALFGAADETLDQAQLRKNRQLAEMLDLKPGHRVLEIGCGWGSFAILLATEYGCHVTAITLSEEQAAWARRRIAELGLEDRIDVRLQDYRDVTGGFDRVASVEMFEAVGEAYWPVFMRKLAECLAPDGRAALQIITIEDSRFENYRRRADFIQRHVFPGGMLPSPSALSRQCDDAGLRIADARYFGLSYARTLAIWNARFQAAWHDIEPLGFTPRFKRLWEFYLAYCEAGFRAGAIDVGHFLITPARG